jgi:hypothetical protein
MKAFWFGLFLWARVIIVDLYVVDVLLSLLVTTTTADCDGSGFTTFEEMMFVFVCVFVRFCEEGWSRKLFCVRCFDV